MTTHTKPARKKMGQLSYLLRFNRLMRGPTRVYSRETDMSALPFPRLIQLQTINACQAACKMCPYPVYKDAFPRGRMDDGLFDKVTDEIASRPEVETFVPMLQNEPFLDKHIFEKITRFKQKAGGRVRVELVTNGAFLTEENIGRIRESELDVLDISLDALSREVYERIRIGLKYDEVIAGVERLVSADLPATSVFVRLVRQKENLHEVRAFTRRWRARGVPVFVYTANNRDGALRNFEKEVSITDEKEPILHKLGRAASRTFYLRHCPVPFATTNILHNGDMLMCVHDWARKDVIGNVRDHTIAELWNGPRMREIRANVHARQYEKVNACRDCSLWRDGWF